MPAHLRCRHPKDVSHTALGVHLEEVLPSVCSRFFHLFRFAVAGMASTCTRNLRNGMPYSTKPVSFSCPGSEHSVRNFTFYHYVIPTILTNDGDRASLTGGGMQPFKKRVTCSMEDVSNVDMLIEILSL